MKLFTLSSWRARPVPRDMLTWGLAILLAVASWLVSSPVRPAAGAPAGSPHAPPREAVTLAPGSGPARPASSGLRYVAPAGQDEGNDCRDPGMPCASAQRGIDVAGNGDQVLVAGGTYQENLEIDRPLSVMGGFDPVTWARDGDLYPTAIDGSASVPVPGDWDGRAVAKAAVIRDNDLFKMWYDGRDLLGKVQVGLATSAGGTTWNKSASNPLLGGSAGQWDEYGEERAPWIIKEGGTFKMWYEGSDGHVRQLGYATSPNGVVWTKHPANPVLQAGPEPYDQDAAAHGSVLHEGIYKLWYHAVGDQGAIIAFATSPDGIHWTKQGPVLLPEGGAWDEGGLWGPSVLRYNGVYWMWYSAVGPQGPPAIGVATSFDGLVWTRVGNGPVLAEEGPLGDPMVLLHGSIFKMWYTDYGAGVIKYAESADGVDWTPSASNPVLTPGEPGQWGEPVVRFQDGSDGAVLDGLDISGGYGEEAGGVHAFQASVTIKDCRIHDNFAGLGDSSEGGGVLGAADGKSLTIEDSFIVHNSSRSGASAVRAHLGTLAMTNVLVAGNQSPEAPALHLNGDATLTNVTVAGNEGGVLHNPPEERILAVRNSVVWGNGWAIQEGPDALVNVRYSDIEGGWFGTGNIDADPLFQAPDDLDYHLAAPSPCVDAANTAWAPDHDLDGDPRPLDGNHDGLAEADMGADEYRPLPVYLPIILSGL